MGTSKQCQNMTKDSKTVGQMGQMGQIQREKLLIHTAIAVEKSCFIFRNQSEMVGQMGQMGDKWDVHLSRQ